MTEQLLAAGWIRRASGRYVHPDLATATNHEGRRRLFTESEALTLLAASIDEGPIPAGIDQEDAS